jgi:hypothetical protein
MPGQADLARAAAVAHPSDDAAAPKRAPTSRRLTARISTAMGRRCYSRAAFARTPTSYPADGVPGRLRPLDAGARALLPPLPPDLPGWLGRWWPSPPWSTRSSRPAPADGRMGPSSARLVLRVQAEPKSGSRGDARHRSSRAPPGVICRLWMQLAVDQVSEEPVSVPDNR